QNRGCGTGRLWAMIPAPQVTAAGYPAIPAMPAAGPALAWRPRPMVRSLWTLLLAACIVPALPGCGGDETPTADGAGAAATEVSTGDSAAKRQPARKPIKPVEYIPQPSIYVNAVGPVEKPQVVVHTSAGDILIELDIEQSPQTVRNFLDIYVRASFYDGTIFHHTDESSLIAAGGFSEDLTQKPTSRPIYNEANNGLSNVRGTVAMSRDADSAHSATSQFFINVVDNPNLDFRGEETDELRGYCVFGRVIEGMEVVDRIAQSQVKQVEAFDRLPVEPVVIQSVEELTGTVNDQ
ncbi:MAG: peptidylprolyl isomerase, partial [Gammaproteobacteria bacterium]